MVVAVGTQGRGGKRVVEHSVSQWIEGLKAGDEQAAEALWRRYYERMVGLARRKFGAASRRAADEEDVALSAFESFARGAQQGRFPNLRDRHDLWRLVFRITQCKAADQVQAETRKKRGGGRVAGESIFERHDRSGDGRGIERVQGREPTPAAAAMTAETVRVLLGLLEGDLRPIALLKLEGFTNAEIAARVGRSPPTVERRLSLIRKIWNAYRTLGT